MYRLDWQPDENSPLPLYLQIKTYMKRKIENGEWPVGSRIPTQRQLAEALGVNRSTVVTALQELTADGLLEGDGRRGTKVVNNPWSLLTSRTPPDWDSYVQAGWHRPNLPTIQTINETEFQAGMIRLSTGEPSPSLYPQPLLGEVFARLASRIHTLGYEEPRGLLPLREQLSRHLQAIGIPASPASVLIVSGALQALQLISLGLVKPGATMITESPSYLHSLHVFHSAGVRLAGLEMDSEGIRIRGLTELKPLPNRMLYTIPSFHNPTGTVMSERRRVELLRECERLQLPVIEDDVYRELWLDAPPPPPLKARDPNGLVLYLGSVSKTVGPGLRTGWIVGPEPVIRRLADLKMQTDYGSSSLSQWALTEWFERGFHEEHLSRVRTVLRQRRDDVLDMLQKHLTGLAVWNVPTGGFYIWLRIVPPVSMNALFARALQEGILFNPGTVYDSLGGPYIRLSYSFESAERLNLGLRKLAGLIRELGAQPK
ncbi:PLP-dependent aminotransferase family protein [Paenibacillus ehimensis]|uniref:PLP-dependent aminotransferase family protein n=1 Tax=Paenibacillus ehimensis TaxID=79264 RepID=A0ABT8VCK6_9BACL|nr:PLP-dependent aminotransferase family protein [Paenibacillus ehimensis]MDO3678724.1 PLP-dependent aminotransferase family protein [Paenibacillus ehimensis]